MKTKNRGRLMVPEARDRKIMQELAMKYGIMNYGSLGYEIVLMGKSIVFNDDKECRVTNFRNAVVWAVTFEKEYGRRPIDSRITPPEAYHTATWFLWDETGQDVGWPKEELS